MNKTIERLITAGMIAVLAMVPLIHTAMAASLAPGDRYQSGFDHGFADQKAGKPQFCSDTHTAIFCNGYNTGWSEAQAGHYHENN